MKLSDFLGRALLLGLALVPAGARAGHWPAWRGPDGNGICDETNLPLRWSTNQNVRWRAALPEPAQLEPVPVR